MITWDLEHLFEANLPDCCLLVREPKMRLSPGTFAPVYIECLPGKWDVYIPHAPVKQMDRSIQYLNTGFCLVHESVRESWARLGAFEIASEPLVRKRLELSCNNYVLGISDASCTQVDSFPAERDQIMARHYEAFSLSASAWEIAQGTRRGMVKTHIPDTYVHESNSLVAFPVNHACSQQVMVTAFFWHKMCVRLECSFSLDASAMRSAQLARPVLPDGLREWIERKGLATYGSDKNALLAYRSRADALAIDDAGPLNPLFSLETPSKRKRHGPSASQEMFQVLLKSFTPTPSPISLHSSEAAVFPPEPLSIRDSALAVESDQACMRARAEAIREPIESDQIRPKAFDASLGTRSPNEHAPESSLRKRATTIYDMFQ